MTSEIVVVRTGISRKELKDRYSDNPTKLQELPEGLRTLAVLGKTFYWKLDLTRVQSCQEVHIYNWEGNQKIVAPILPEECYSIKEFDKDVTIIAFDPRAVRFEVVEPPRKFGRASAFYENLDD